MVEDALSVINSDLREGTSTLFSTPLTVSTKLNFRFLTVMVALLVDRCFKREYDIHANVGQLPNFISRSIIFSKCKFEKLLSGVDC